MGRRQMTRVRVGEHLIINLSRRSLCDNCAADLCMIQKTERVVQCEDFRSPFIVLRKCRSCGQIFDVFSNINSLDFSLCPKCSDDLRSK